MSGELEPRPRGSFTMFGNTPSRGTLYRTSTLLWLAGIAMISVPMVTLIDIPTARWFSNNTLPREAVEALDLMRLFSHGWGVLLVLLAIGLFSPRHRWNMPRLGAIAMGAGAVSTLVKMFILRPRPSRLNLEISSYDTAWLWAFDGSLEQVAAFDASTRSFPSSNMATAIALTVGLWVLLPRGRWLFAIVCCGAILQRLTSGSHFLSDLFGGAAIGLLWSYTCLHPSMLGSLFDKMEPEKDRRRGKPIDEVDVVPTLKIVRDDDSDTNGFEKKIAA